MKFGKKTMFIIVLIFLGILLFMYFRNSGREGMSTSTRRRNARTQAQCTAAGKGKWNKNAKVTKQCT